MGMDLISIAIKKCIILISKQYPLPATVSHDVLLIIVATYCVIALNRTSLTESGALTLRALFSRHQWPPF